MPKIIAAQAPVLGGAGQHNFWVLVGDNGQVLSQLHGFQAGPNGEPSTTGVGGTLRVYNNYGMEFNSSTSQQVVFEGEAEAVAARWNAALDCKTLINEKNYSYNALDIDFLGHNSNSVASTLAACMGLSEPNLGGYIPGFGEIILSAQEIQYIQSDYDDITGCVATISHLPDGKIAGDIRVGDTMQLADHTSLEAATGEVTFSVEKTCPGFRIVTVSGATLMCSDTAPIPTLDGLVLAPDLLGKAVAVRRDGPDGSKNTWEEVIEVQDIGSLLVQHITVGDRCFWAGEKPGVYILHHNMKAGPGGGTDPWDWDDWWFPISGSNDSENNIVPKTNAVGSTSQTQHVTTTIVNGELVIVGVPMTTLQLLT